MFISDDNVTIFKGTSKGVPLIYSEDIENNVYALILKKITDHHSLPFLLYPSNKVSR